MTVNDTKDIENTFLEKVKGKGVQVYLGNGIKLIGTVTSFDDYTILLSAPTYGVQLIYKHSITTISPYNVSR